MWSRPLSGALRWSCICVDPAFQTKSNDHWTDTRLYTLRHSPPKTWTLNPLSPASGEVSLGFNISRLFQAKLKKLTILKDFQGCGCGISYFLTCTYSWSGLHMLPTDNRYKETVLTVRLGVFYANVTCHSAVLSASLRKQGIRWVKQRWGFGKCLVVIVWNHFMVWIWGAGSRAQQSVDNAALAMFWKCLQINLNIWREGRRGLCEILPRDFLLSHRCTGELRDRGRRQVSDSQHKPPIQEREVHCKGQRLFCQTTPDGAQHLSGHLGRIMLAQQFSAHGFGFGLTTSRRLWWETWKICKTVPCFHTSHYPVWVTQRLFDPAHSEGLFPQKTRVLVKSPFLRPSLLTLSHITEAKRIKIWECSPLPVGQNWGPSEGVQMAAASSLWQEWHCRHLSCVSLHTEQASFFLIGCFRCWTKQPPTRARTSARCIMGTIYQSHHALQALNTATVFLCVSPLFFRCHLSHLSLSPSLDGSFAGAAVSF